MIQLKVGDKFTNKYMPRYMFEIIGIHGETVSVQFGRTDLENAELEIEYFWIIKHMQWAFEAGDYELLYNKEEPIKEKENIPKGTIEVTIHFINHGPSVRDYTETYNMTLPDFRIDWTETDEVLKDFIEEKRRNIQSLYNEFGNGEPQVKFSFELNHIEVMEELHGAQEVYDDSIESIYQNSNFVKTDLEKAFKAGEKVDYLIGAPDFELWFKRNYLK